MVHTMMPQCLEILIEGLPQKERWGLILEIAAVLGKEGLDKTATIALVVRDLRHPRDSRLSLDDLYRTLKGSGVSTLQYAIGMQRGRVIACVVFAPWPTT